MTSNRPDNNCTYTTPYANTHTSALCSVVERQRTVCCWVKPVCELLAPVFFYTFRLTVRHVISLSAKDAHYALQCDGRIRCLSFIRTLQLLRKGRPRQGIRKQLRHAATESIRRRRQQIVSLFNFKVIGKRSRLQDRIFEIFTITR